MVYSRRKNRDTIHFNGEHCNIDLLYRTIHSANQLCIYGAVTKRCGKKSGEASQSRLESARKTSQKIQIKQEDLKSLVDIPRLPHASGNRMLQNLKDFNSMPFMSKIEYLRTTAKLGHPMEKGNHYVTTTLEEDGWWKRTSMCKEFTAPRNLEDSRPYASIDAEQEIGPVLNIGIAAAVGVPGVEDWVPRDTLYGFWQVAVTKDLRMKLIVTTLTSWTTVPRCARRKTASMMISVMRYARKNCRFLVCRRSQASGQQRQVVPCSFFCRQR